MLVAALPCNDRLTFSDLGISGSKYVSLAKCMIGRFSTSGVRARATKKALSGSDDLNNCVRL